MSDPLRRRAWNALGWAYSATAARIAVQFVCGVALARMLGPEPFGMVAAAWVMVGVASQFVDCGFGSALVQRAEISRQDIRYAFTLQVLAGILLFSTMATGAGVLARWVGQPAMRSLIVLLSVNLLLQALGQTASSLLRRSLDFRTLQLAQLGGTVAGYALVALPLAWAGYGARSLVAAQLTQTLVATSAVYLRVRHPVLPFLDRRRRALVQFGLKVTAANLVNWTIASLDSLALTRFFGATVTGLYNRAQVLALVPAGQLVQVLQSVLFPAYSRRVEETSLLRSIYLSSLAALGLVLLPAGVTFAIAARTTVVALYGPNWETAAAFLTPLALAMPLHCVMALNGPLLWARDRVGEELAIQCGVLLLFAISLWLASHFPPAAMAWTVLAVYAVRCLAMMSRTLAAVGARWRDVVSAMRGPLIVAAPAAGMSSLIDALMAAQPAMFRLLVISTTTALTVGGAALVLPPSLLPDELRHAIHGVRRRLGGWSALLAVARPHAGETQ